MIDNHCRDKNFLGMHKLGVIWEYFEIGGLISIGVIILLVLIIVVSISLPLALRENSDSDSDSETATTTTTATTAIDKTCNTTYTPCKDPNLSLCVIPLPEKITLGMRCPEVGMCPDKLCIYAARGEFEAFKLLVNGGGSSYLLGYTDIYSAHGTLDIFRADFEGDVGVEEGLYQIYNQTHIIVNQTTSLWGIAKINYGVESTKSQGERYTGQLIIGEEAIGIQLYVYDFELPREIHYFSQLNIKVKDLDPENTTMAHWNILKNRMTPKSCTWPSGFGAGITWDTDRNPNKCSSFYNESDEGNAYSILHLAEKYLLGNPEWNEWNLTYPSFMLFQFVDNSHTRPNTFCGEDLGPDQCGSTAYNTKYKEYLVSLRDYLKSINVLERSYVYIQNEPQDSEDYRVAVCLCKMYRETVPDLRIAVSEEAKKEISGECGYDIYIAHMGYDFDYEYSMGRLKEGEVSYIYSLPHDEKPWINPIKLTSHGLDALLLCWVSWLQRIRGYAYYSYSQFFRGGVGTVITQLLRESFEDYEYLYLGNNKKLPMTESNNVDNIVRQVATNFMSVSRDSMGVMNFRRDLGFWVEGGSKPAFLPTNIIHTRGEYYINFQNRTGEPSALPLIIGGKEYKKWGLEGYDSTQGLGWLGEHVGDGSNILQCKYVDIGGEYSELEKSFIYDDYGRTLLFEFSIEPGEYTAQMLSWFGLY